MIDTRLTAGLDTRPTAGLDAAPGTGIDREEEPAMASCRVAQVDDHDIVTVAIRSLVDSLPGLTFVGSARTVGELVAQTRQIDLVVLDLRLADGSSPTENVERIRAIGANVLAFTSGESPYLIREVARADVLGVVRKSAPTPEIVDALLQAAHGRFRATNDWAAAIDSDPDITRARLTPREHQVLELYASGKAAKQVAFELGIKENTVDDYVKRIRTQYATLGRDSNTKLDLYRRGIEDGYIPLPPVTS